MCTLPCFNQLSQHWPNNHRDCDGYKSSSRHLPAIVRGPVIPRVPLSVRTAASAICPHLTMRFARLISGMCQMRTLYRAPGDGQ